MILYYSGTGNSKYIAEHIARATNDTLISINEKIKSDDYSPIISEGKIIFVTPTYGWRIPRIVENWIRKVNFSGVTGVWFVMSCGSEIGNADKYIRNLCNDKEFKYMGVKGIVMPENYIAMFDAPDEKEAKEIIERAGSEINDTVEKIQNGLKFDAPKNNLYDRIMSSVVNPVFYKFFVKADGFKVSDSCIGCGKCVILCPLNNIQLINNKPEWGNNCTHCMSCICHCPTEAIEYKNKSIGKPRYHLD